MNGIKITVGISNELIWYKIFIDNYIRIKESKPRELPNLLIIENYLIAYISIYNVFESYIDILIKELGIKILKENGKFKTIYDKINDIDTELKKNIEKDITLIKDHRNMILHLNTIEFNIDNTDEKLTCKDYRGFDFESLLKNYNKIINLIDIIGKEFFVVYCEDKTIMGNITSDNIADIYKFFGTMKDMQKTLGLKEGELILPIKLSNENNNILP